MALELGGGWRACAGHPPVVEPRLHRRPAPLRQRPARAALPALCQLDGAGLGSSGGGGGSSSAGSSGGERLPLPRKSAKLEPSLYLSPEDAVIAQLKVRVGSSRWGPRPRRRRRRRRTPSKGWHNTGADAEGATLLQPCCRSSRPVLLPVPPPPQALQHNSFPSPDHGIEVMYRFSAFDPFTRCDYFGRTLDLGQVRAGDVPLAAGSLAR